MNKYLLFYYVFLNCLGLILMAWDKYQAQKNGWRTSEKTLLFVGMVGGALGAYFGMKIFHHKTKHWYFGFIFSVSIFAHILIIWRLIP